MALKKSIIVASVGAPAEIHTVDSFTVNDKAKSTTASLSSYYSTSALAQGLSPLAQFSVQLDGVPTKGQDGRDFVNDALIAAAPDGVQFDPLIQQYGASRYVFAAAEVLDV